jgi:hypothetical protein
MYNYEDRNHTTTYNKILDYIDMAITCVFFLECIIKILAMGFVLHKHAYLREFWNIIDFIIVIGGIFEFVSTFYHIKGKPNL